MEHYLFGLDEPPVNIEPLDDSIGHVMGIGEFLEDCICERLTDYDGYCKFIVTVGGQHYEITNMSFNIEENDVYLNDEVIACVFTFCRVCGIRKVIWFNK